MRHYNCILFDADETLFHFDAFTGLVQLFSQFGVQFTRQNFEEYEATNKPLWKEYQNGEITAHQLQHRRFEHWANTMQIEARTLNSAYMAIMAEICTPIDGAMSLLRALKGKTRLGIITNGFTELQQARLKRMGLRDHFDCLVISEEVGFAKPHKGIFDHTLSIMGNPSRKQVLMVGDNPYSDILGGINAGLDTCWLNIHNKPAPEGISPQYEVSSLSELEEMLLESLPLY